MAMKGWRGEKKTTSNTRVDPCPSSATMFLTAVAPYGSSVTTPPLPVILEGATATEGSEAAQRITISVASLASVAFSSGEGVSGADG